MVISNVVTGCGYLFHFHIYSDLPHLRLHTKLSLHSHSQHTLYRCLWVKERDKFLLSSRKETPYRKELIFNTYPETR